MDHRLTEVVSEENETFRKDCCTLYVECTATLGVLPKLDDALFVLGAANAKKYTDAAVAALDRHNVVMVAGRGEHVRKAVTVVEQTKQRTPGRVEQLNKLSLEPSLINPAFKLEASAKNVQAFYGDVDSSKDVAREIRGHKVYTVPTLAVVLVRGSMVPDGQFKEWTRQTKQ